MAAKKLVPVRVKSGTYYHREKGKESADKVYKAHEENNNVLLLPAEEAKSLLERFVNKFEILNEIEYKLPENTSEESSEEESSEEESEEGGEASGDEDFGTEVTKSFDEAKGTKCQVYVNGNNLYTVIGPEGEVIKKEVSEAAARKTLKKFQPAE